MTGRLAEFALRRELEAQKAELQAWRTRHEMDLEAAQITQQLQSFTVDLPQASSQLISAQLSSITQSSSGALTSSLVCNM